MTDWILSESCHDMRKDLYYSCAECTGCYSTGLDFDERNAIKTGKNIPVDND